MYRRAYFPYRGLFSIVNRKIHKQLKNVTYKTYKHVKTINNNNHIQKE